jgi:hypothetical protein
MEEQSLDLALDIVLRYTQIKSISGLWVKSFVQCIERVKIAYRILRKYPKSNDA